MLNHILYGLESVAIPEMFAELARLEKAVDYAETAVIKARHDGIYETDEYITPVGELILDNEAKARKALADYADCIWRDVHDCIEMQMYCAEKAGKEAGYKFPYTYHDYEDDIVEMILKKWGIWEYLE